MKQVLTAILLIACIPGYSHSQKETVTISPGFLKGKDYLDMGASEKRAYAMGAINGMTVAPMLGASEEKVTWLRTYKVLSAMPAQDKGEQSDPGGIADKACWTEPLVTRGKLASSMGIVKWKGVATNEPQMRQAA